MQEHPGLAGLSIGVAASSLAAALHAGVLARRADARLSFSLLALATAVFAAASAVVAASPGEAMGALSIAEAARHAASCLAVRDAVNRDGEAKPARLLFVLYAATAFFVTASFAGWTLGLWAPLARPAALFALAAVLAPATLLARRVMRGEPNGLELGGATVLVVAAASDALHILGDAPGPPLASLGFGAFVATVVLSGAASQATRQRVLKERAAELERRAAEIARDRAELRADKEELVRKEQLAAVGELSAVIAHEVRNPLAIIANAVATLRRGQLDAADRETLLGILDEETTRLNHLVGDLLRYTRPVDPQRQLLGVREILGRALAVASQRADVTIEVVESGEAPRVWGDANLLRQAFENLISNAIQAMAGGGSLTMTLAPREADGVAGLELDIQDTGEGMDTLVRKRALDPFFTTRPAGTGLGLAIVARIVDAHGGRLTIDSKAGQGTRVSVFLPVGSEEGEQLVLDRVSDVPLPAELKRALGRR